jgi:CDP-diglyceride synthetase
MNFVMDLKLLVLLAAANGAPVIAKNIIGGRWSFPLDSGAVLPDGQRLFGPSKSIRGVVLSLLLTGFVAPILQIDWTTGLLVAGLAMTGDICSSFLKRRLKMPSSSMAIGLDQIPESLFPSIGFSFIVPLPVIDIAAVVAIFLVGELAISRVLFHFGLRDRPY